MNETITVRRIFQGIGVERVFMLHAPVASIKVERRGKVRRAAVCGNGGAEMPGKGRSLRFDLFFQLPPSDDGRGFIMRR